MGVGTAAARRQATPPEAAATERHAKVRDPELAPLILIVDDVEDTRELYSVSLSNAGLRTALAVDGEHALWKVLTLMPSLVVMDLAMPVLDGWEATHQIKTNPKTKGIPVVVLTGHATTRDLRRARDAGADAVLLKPCLPDALLVIVRQLLER